MLRRLDVLLTSSSSWLQFRIFNIFSALPEAYSICRIIATVHQKNLPSLKITKQFSFIMHVYPTYSYYSLKWVPYFSNTRMIVSNNLFLFLSTLSELEVRFLSNWKDRNRTDNFLSLIIETEFHLARNNGKKFINTIKFSSVWKEDWI